MGSAVLCTTEEISALHDGVNVPNLFEHSIAVGFQTYGKEHHPSPPEGREIICGKENEKHPSLFRQLKTQREQTLSLLPLY